MLQFNCVLEVYNHPIEWVLGEQLCIMDGLVRLKQEAFSQLIDRPREVIEHHTQRPQVLILVVL